LALTPGQSRALVPMFHLSGLVITNVSSSSSTQYISGVCAALATL
jgi:hypothetical protein